MTTLYDNSAIDDEPMEFLLIDGRPAFRRLGPDVAYEAKYEVAENVCVQPVPGPCGDPFPECAAPVFAEVPADILAAPITGTALPTDATEAWYVPSAINAGYAPDGILTYGDVIHEGDAVSFSLDAMSMKQGRADLGFVIFTARPHGWQYDHPAPVPLPAGFGLLIAALLCVAAVRRK